MKIKSKLSKIVLITGLILGLSNPGLADSVKPIGKSEVDKTITYTIKYHDDQSYFTDSLKVYRCTAMDMDSNEIYSWFYDREPFDDYGEKDDLMINTYAPTHVQSTDEGVDGSVEGSFPWMPRSEAQRTYNQNILRFNRAIERKMNMGDKDYEDSGGVWKSWRDFL